MSSSDSIGYHSPVEEPELIQTNDEEMEVDPFNEEMEVDQFNEEMERADNILLEDINEALKAAEEDHHLRLEKIERKKYLGPITLGKRYSDVWMQNLRYRVTHQLESMTLQEKIDEIEEMEIDDGGVEEIKRWEVVGVIRRLSPYRRRQKRDERIRPFQHYLLLRV